MISVTRKTHIPNWETSFCCSRVSNCSTRAESWWCGAEWTVVAWLSDNFFLLGQAFVIVGFLGDDRRLVEVVRRRRRRGLPLEAGGAIRVISGDRSIFQRPHQIKHWKQQTHCEHRRSRRGEHVQHLELRRINMVAPGHAHVSKHELRKERQIESDE